MSLQKPDFYNWTTMYSITDGKLKGYKLGVKEFYEQISGIFHNKGDKASINASLNELEWHNNGKPYYKVFPSMLDQLSNVKIDIDGRYLFLPFPQYEVRLAKEYQFKEYEGAPVLRSLFICEEKVGIDRRYTLAVHYQFDSDINAEWHGWFFAMPIREGITLEYQIHETFTTKSTIYKEGYNPSEEFCRKIVRLAVSVAFFGVNQHELICPDIPRKFITKFHAAKQEKNESEAKKILDKAKRIGHFGWKIGGEIDLPTPIIHHETLDKSDRKYELNFGHIRRGHMRLQPYGNEQNKHYELIFIPPTVVRPDLPLAAMRGFRIRK